MEIAQCIRGFPVQAWTWVEILSTHSGMTKHIYTQCCGGHWKSPEASWEARLAEKLDFLFSELPWLTGIRARETYTWCPGLAHACMYTHVYPHSTFVHINSHKHTPYPYITYTKELSLAVGLKWEARRIEGHRHVGVCQAEHLCFDLFNIVSILESLYCKKRKNDRLQLLKVNRLVNKHFDCHCIKSQSKSHYHLHFNKSIS